MVLQRTYSISIIIIVVVICYITLAYHYSSCYVSLYYNIIRYCIILYYIFHSILYYIVIYSIMLYCIMLYYIMLYYIILYYIILYYNILYYIILYYTILYYIILHLGITQLPALLFTHVSYTCWTWTGERMTTSFSRKSTCLMYSSLLPKVSISLSLTTSVPGVVLTSFLVTSYCVLRRKRSCYFILIKSYIYLNANNID